MKRYSKEHDEVWFLGISAYQWSSVVPMTLLCLVAGIAGSHEPFGWKSLLGGAVGLVVWYGLAWLSWFGEC